ncbi:GMC family oxidoreductase [Bradyrhizobium betae]|uniref:Glucose-methanol-choline oxidoreductase N-terminal domain-containing protein n=1 Tax=Bradyrhizobium betae TaxID=244734 RepID=A0A4Q1VPQ0_9BRAD|nr:GMC family oxidoreductase N-terminal domain-containing protein [Bradyrhizobium betae]RXT54252.1 hypothetical protein B5V03_02090 [Bradyrhizobium betae]
MNPQRYDIVIVGGGAAGCVLANRLSADSGTRVLLIEAGNDFEPGKEPAAIRDRGVRTTRLPQYYWPGLLFTDGPRRGPFMQARVMGGGSSINGMHAQRGVPRDYDEWRQLGIVGWGWDDVLPYFKRLERDIDFDTPDHGQDGPITVQRVPQKDWSSFSRAFQDALSDRNVPPLADINTQAGDGSGPVPLNIGESSRLSSAIAYLTPSIRRRSNLAIRASTEVLRVILVGGMVTGLELVSGEIISTGQVIVCAGAIHSPALLQRSGIGPGAKLKEAGVSVALDLPGVGRNLRNHPIVTVSSHLKPRGRQRNKRVRPPSTMIARYSSNVAGTQPTDMLLTIWERNLGPLEVDPLGGQLSQSMVILNKPYSHGEVGLTSGAPMGPPTINAACLSDPRDLERMVLGFKMVCDILSSNPVGSFVNHSFVANISMGKPPDLLTARVLQDNITAKLLSAVGAVAMDLLPMFRNGMMNRVGSSVSSILADADNLPAFVKSIVYPGGHPGGTCQMGPKNQTSAVVDSRCRVWGVEGLRVVDASIFPTLMSGGTNIPTMMAAEKAADLILEDRNANL